MDRINVPKEWKRWSFQGEFLIDEAHNKYHINDIRALFFQRQLHNELLGNKYDIKCLKEALQEKLKELNSEIVIQLVNNGECIKEQRFII